MYKCLVRPAADYSACVYGPMLSDDQAKRIEKQQQQIMKVIFGFDKSYREILEKYDIITLKQRREELLDSFILKSLKNPRFRDKWFPLRERNSRNLRSENRFIEKYARTDRLRKSPLYTMRRRANEMHKAGLLE